MIPSIDVDQITNVAILAGNAIMEVYQMEDFSSIIDIKPDHSPLTLADKKSNEIITSYLLTSYPEIPIISEEEELVSFEKRSKWKTFWLVDPLDGTKEFIKRNGEFTVNIALIHESIPVFGCIYIPATGILYFGNKEKGAIRKKEGNSVYIHVSEKKSGLTAIGSRSHSNEDEQKVLSGYAVENFLTAGSSLKFCRVAEGMADIYYRSGPTMEWDIAAGQAIVEAAGGYVLDAAGKPFRYNKPDLLNGPFLCLGTQSYKK